MKRPIRYRSPFSVRPDGMFVQGFVDAEEVREHSVEVKGPASIRAHKGQGLVTGHFHAEVLDLRTPLTYAWTSSDEVVLDPDHPAEVTVRFTPPPPGAALSSQVGVTVTDADGLIATHEERRDLRRQVARSARAGRRLQ